MSNARSRKLRASLGDSWGDAAYSSDGGASIHSTSSFGSENEEEDMATPLPPPRTTRASSQTPQDTAHSLRTSVPKPGRRPVARTPTNAQTARSHQSTPESAEPSFIMPSMSGTNDFNNGSPLRKSQLRTRKPRQTGLRTKAGNMDDSPRVQNEHSKVTRNERPPAQQEQEEPKLGNYIDLLWRHVLWPVIQYILGVFRYAMHHFGTPILGTALAVLLLAASLKFASIFLQSALQRTLTPLCLFPGSSYVVPSICGTRGPRLPHSSPDFDALVSVQSSFEEVVQASKDANDLSMHIRDGTNSVHDIRSLVKHSDLPSRHLLDVELATFMDIGKEASEQLTNYNVKIGRTLSKVIITNDWTLRDLESIAEREANTGSVSRALSYMNPLSVFIAPPSTVDEMIFDRYTTHLSQIKDEILLLIDVATTLKQLLGSLESQLDIIGDTAIHDDVKISRKHDDLLSSLWTMMGGNRSASKANQRSLSLLRNILGYKNTALDHVSITLTKLQEIAAGLEDLSADVGRPEVLGYRNDVPLRYHIEVISKSLEGFTDLKGEMLGVNRDSVRMAMERLSGDAMNRVRGLPDSAGRGKGSLPTVKAGK